MTAQTTLKQAVSCSGIGLHRGIEVHLRLLPAKADTGIVFRRTDVEKKRGLIPARHDLVTDTRLGTTLRNAHNVSVSTVEHLMAALWGAGVDNAVIELDAPEVPIMDGSSDPFMALIAQAGIRKLASPRKILRVYKEIEVVDGESVARVAPFEGQEFGCGLDIAIDYPNTAIPRQNARYDFGRVTFAQALAGARTFGFAHEVEQLRAHGLALGGSLDNAIVVGEHGVLNPGGLRYSDEFVRHKALDCIGDLFLAGHRIEGAFTFTRPGHGINNKLLRALLADADACKLVTTVPAAQPAEIAQPAYL